MKEKTLVDIVDTYGTPLYVFDLDALADRAQRVRDAFSSDVGLCFSVKANPFLANSLPPYITRLEVCSPGELVTCKALGIVPEQIIYSGVNKTEKNIIDAIRFGIGTLTAESARQLDFIDRIAGERGILARVLLRLTGDDQFGMDETAIRDIIAQKDDYTHIKIIGLHFFSGTQKRKASMIAQELAHIIEFSDEILAAYDFDMRCLEYGPGLFADYYGDAPEASELALLADVAPHINAAADRFDLTIELGRFFASPCGSYLTRIADIKTNHGIGYVIVDGGIHQTGYDGLMLSAKPPHIRVLSKNGRKTEQWTICGSLCARSDVLARKVPLPAPDINDVLVFEQTGAYAVTEGVSLFLSRDLPAICLWSSSDGAVLIRRDIETYTFNTPQY